MNIRDIRATLVELRNGVLADLEVPESEWNELEFAPPPEPEMGDVGFPCFALAPVLEDSPQRIAGRVADAIAGRSADLELVADVRAEGPYVNFALDPGRVSTIVVSQALDAESFGANFVEDPDRWMIEFSAPNTNKPQHLGHVRNNLLGDTVSSIAGAAGDEVIRTNLINDRGVHICKSMVAYRLDGDAPTPEEVGAKGDHFVGEYYVEFGELVDEEYEAWQETDEAERQFREWVDEERAADRLPDDLGEQRTRVRSSFFDAFRDDFFAEYSELGAEAREMLRDWEEGDERVRELWRRMNGWVYEGFRETYERLGLEFDEIYYESETYGRGKEIIEEGLERGIFERRDDGAVVFDLDRVDEEGLEGEKVVLRADGTTVYVTQDLGTAAERFDEYDPDRMIYVVADEQDYHFRVLFSILEEFDSSLGERLHHLSYGMVDLPEGKMKSREGKVVDADELMDEMAELAEGAVRRRYEDLPEDEIARRAERIGMAALKFDLLDYNPETNVQFDPESSIDFQGRTGPYCLYSYARVQSIGRRVGGWPEVSEDERREVLEALGTERELEVVRKLRDWPETLREAYRDLDPSELTGYLFELAQTFSSLYNDPDHRIVDLDGPRRTGLLLLARAVARTVRTGLSILGIETLEQM